MQSIKNKESLLLDQIITGKIDVCVVSETWFQNNDADNIWIKTSVLNTGDFRLDNANRSGKKGGGLATIWNNNTVKCKVICHLIKTTFEYAIWTITTGHKSLHLVCIIHQANILTRHL